ncbi:MAG: hypothetical protein Kow00124_08700 [Anaerolineae bacterium]
MSQSDVCAKLARRQLLPGLGSGPLRDYNLAIRLCDQLEMGCDAEALFFTNPLSMGCRRAGGRLRPVARWLRASA